MRKQITLEIYDDIEKIISSYDLIRVLKKINGTTLSLLTGVAGNNNYHHWLYDVLPRLGLCSKAINLEKIERGNIE